MTNTQSEQTSFTLEPDEQVTHWYNIVADLPVPPPPPLHPGTREPVGPDDLAPLFPPELIAQEVSGERYVEIPEPVLDVYRQYRPSPLYRARRWEQKLGTSARIYYKYEGVSPAGSHKVNTAVPQVYYNKLNGITRLTTETGAGQWGTALSYAAALFGVECEVWQVGASYDGKPYRKSVMETFGATLHRSPSELTESGRKALEDEANHSGSLGIAISEAVEGLFLPECEAARARGIAVSLFSFEDFQRGRFSLKPQPGAGELRGLRRAAPQDAAADRHLTEVAAIRDASIQKGDVLTVAKVAGILAAKPTLSKKATAPVSSPPEPNESNESSRRPREITRLRVDVPSRGAGTEERCTSQAPPTPRTAQTATVPTTRRPVFQSSSATRSRKTSSCSPSDTRATGTPTARALGAAPPTAKIQLPMRVRSRIQVASATKKIHQSTVTRMVTPPTANSEAKTARWRA